MENDSCSSLVLYYITLMPVNVRGQNYYGMKSECKKTISHSSQCSTTGVNKTFPSCFVSQGGYFSTKTNSTTLLLISLSVITDCFVCYYKLVCLLLPIVLSAMCVKCVVK